MGLLTNLVEMHDEKKRKDRAQDIQRWQTIVAMPDVANPDTGQPFVTREMKQWASQNLAGVLGEGMGLPKKHHSVIHGMISAMAGLNPAPPHEAAPAGAAPGKMFYSPDEAKQLRGAAQQEGREKKTADEQAEFQQTTTEERARLAEKDKWVDEQVAAGALTNQRGAEMKAEFRGAKASPFLNATPTNIEVTDASGNKKRIPVLQHKTGEFTLMDGTTPVDPNSITDAKPASADAPGAGWADVDDGKGGTTRVFGHVDPVSRTIRTDDGKVYSGKQLKRLEKGKEPPNYSSRSPLEMLATARKWIQSGTPEQKAAGRQYLYHTNLGDTATASRIMQTQLTIEADRENLGMDPNLPGGGGGGGVGVPSFGVGGAPAPGTGNTRPGPGAGPGAGSGPGPGTSTGTGTGTGVTNAGQVAQTITPPPADARPPNQKFVSFDTRTKSWTGADGKRIDGTAEVTKGMPPPKLEVATALSRATPRQLSDMSYAKDVLLGNIAKGGDKFTQAQFKRGMRAFHAFTGLSEEQLSASLKERKGVGDALVKNSERYSAFTRLDNELNNMGQLLQDARARVPDYNRFLNKLATHVQQNFRGDKETAALVIAANGYARVYTTLVGGGWTSNAMPHVASESQANEALAASMTSGQIDGVIEQVHREAVGVRKALVDTTTDLLGQLKTPLGQETSALTTGGEGKTQTGQSKERRRPLSNGQYEYNYTTDGGKTWQPGRLPSR